jgi:N-methylhydantoinase B/oxoprolinase/acetone carboxylase alpha subunit
MKDQIDPISLEIMWSRLVSIANQGASTLLRTSFSTLVGFAQDFKFALTDSRGRSIAPSDAGDALFFVTFPHCLRAMLEVFPPETLAPRMSVRQRCNSETSGQCSPQMRLARS